MRFTVDSDQLKDAFSKCASVAPSRSPKEILMNVLFRMEGDKLLLVGTDTNSSVIAELEAQVDKPGSMLISSERLGRLVRELHGELSFEFEGSQILLRAPGAEYKLPTASANEFPAPKRLAVEEMKVDSETFMRAIKKTIFACEQDSARYALGGVRLDSGLVIGCDGRRLATCQLGLPEDVQALIPEKAAQTIASMLRDETAYICHDLNSVQVRCGKFTLITRQLEGRYPDWRQVLPSKDDKYRATLTAGSLYSAIRQAAIATDTETRGVDLSFSEGAIDLKAQAAEKGQASVSVPAEYNGSPTTVKLDHKYCEEFLRTCESSDVVSIYVGEPSQSVLFEDANGAAYVVMPMAKG